MWLKSNEKLEPLTNVTSACCPTKEAYKWKTSKATLRLDMFG